MKFLILATLATFAVLGLAAPVAVPGGCQPGTDGEAHTDTCYTWIKRAQFEEEKAAAQSGSIE